MKARNDFEMFDMYTTKIQVSLCLEKQHLKLGGSSIAVAGRTSRISCTAIHYKQILIQWCAPFILFYTKVLCGKRHFVNIFKAFDTDPTF